MTEPIYRRIRKHLISDDAEYEEHPLFPYYSNEGKKVLKKEPWSNPVGSDDTSTTIHGKVWDQKGSLRDLLEWINFGECESGSWDWRLFLRNSPRWGVVSEPPDLTYVGDGFWSVTLTPCTFEDKEEIPNRQPEIDNRVTCFIPADQIENPGTLTPQLRGGPYFPYLPMGDPTDQQGLLLVGVISYQELDHFWGITTSNAYTEGGTYPVYDFDQVGVAFSSTAAEKNENDQIPIGTKVRIFPAAEGFDVEWAFEFGREGAEPSDTVEDETTWGIAPDKGVADTYSRGDHTHGTPAEPDVGPTYTDGLGIVFSGVNLDVINVDLAGENVRGLQFIGVGNAGQLAVLLKADKGLAVDAEGVYVAIGNGLLFSNGLVTVLPEPNGPVRVTEAGVDVVVEGGIEGDSRALNDGWILVDSISVRIAHGLPQETYLDTSLL